MVMDMDGSMARLETPVTARAALGGDAWSCFVCSADELDFDAPVRALDAEEALQSGQLYFVLPLPALRRPLPGRDMAALALRASAALGSIGVDGLIPTAGVSSPLSTRRKDGDGAAAGKRRKTSRVAPLVVVSSIDDACAPVAFGDHRTAGKTTAKGARRRAGVQRLSAILEASE
ncbi:hypothetical protein E2562_016463 [Oryza meyeriana var. granulata]|uniref:Uncharacterized protein n=1 Tax=Oryza meyeriana var. granulata TaxID=110450 RepID=A0A6G1EXA3_9ORYZ|nr:hypothetical protein E2562_016463 [Oryza meyeriana var. granulata]